MILSLVVEGFTRGSLTRGVTALLLGDEDRPPDLVVHFTHIEAEGTARCMTGSACNSIGGTFPPGQFGHYYLARRAVSRGSVTGQPPGWIELRQSRRPPADGLGRTAVEFPRDRRQLDAKVVRRSARLPGARVVTRMDKQKLILSLVSRAGVPEQPPDAPVTSSSQTILVLQGAHKSSLDIFDQHGNRMGAANRSRGRYSRDACQIAYEVLGVEPRFVLTDISKGRWISVHRDFTIAGVDGSHIAAAHRYSDKGQPVLRRSDRLSRPGRACV